ncbi:MAG: hypothetical protein Q9227_007137 [Pyrenula ochraceoflavens]
MSSRVGLRLFSQSLRPQSQPQFIRHSFLRQRQPIPRRYQTTDAASSSTAGPAQSSFARWFNSEIGPKTVHFWAPVMKWAIVLAGVSDFFRPAEKLSLTQNLALTATGSMTEAVKSSAEEVQGKAEAELARAEKKMA